MNYPSTPTIGVSERHPLALVIAAFVLATLVGRQKLSSIHRFMRNRADWLHELMQIPKVKPISRAHLPRLLDGLNWLVLNELIERCFGVRVYSPMNPENGWRSMAKHYAAYWMPVTSKI